MTSLTWLVAAPLVLGSHPVAGQEEDPDVAAAREARAEAVEVLGRLVDLELFSFQIGKGSLQKLIDGEARLAAARQRLRPSVIELLQGLQKQRELAGKIRAHVEKRHDQGVADAADVLLARANELEREADLKEGQALARKEAVAVMRKSIEAREIKEFSAEEVRAWRGGLLEELEGEIYLVGQAAFEQHTVQTRIIQAKAYIRDGKVVKWVDAKSGAAIR